MQIEIKKRQAFMIFGAILLLAGAYTVYAVVGVSHTADEMRINLS